MNRQRSTFIEVPELILPDSMKRWKIVPWKY
jgi:hypothetical protein